jgi:ATP-dependent Lhr-like helicase
MHDSLRSGSIPPSVYRAFLGSFGGRPRGVQTRSEEIFSSTGDVIVIAPTGGGKTEAVFIPVSAALLGQPAHPDEPLCLVVSPTRALATDLHKRMSQPLSDLGLRISVETSDKRCVRANGAHILIRTPEGIDGQLCRGPRAFHRLSFVLLDEVHTYLGDPRGTQLVGLLARLDDATEGRIRRIGISATVDDPSDFDAFRILRTPLVVSDESVQPPPVVGYFPWNGGNGSRRFVDYIRRSGIKKAIAFTRSRTRAETLCQELNQGHLAGNCFVHHASLSPALRRQSEERFRRKPVAIIVATTTLEVGIDIGSVDTVILFDAPPTSESYAQRIGRGGRRSGNRRVVIVTDLYDRRIAFARVMGRGGASARDLRQCFSGILQQASSFVAQRGPLQVAELMRFVQRAFGSSEQVSSAALRALRDGLVLRQDGAGVHLSEHGQVLLERRHLHMTFAPHHGHVIFDNVSGQAVGQANATEGEPFLLGGKPRRFKKIDGLTMHVLTNVARRGTARFMNAGKSHFERLAETHCLVAGGECQTR